MASGSLDSCANQRFGKFRRDGFTRLKNNRDRVVGYSRHKDIGLGGSVRVNEGSARCKCLKLGKRDARFSTAGNIGKRDFGDRLKSSPVIVERKVERDFPACRNPRRSSQAFVGESLEFGKRIGCIDGAKRTALKAQARCSVDDALCLRFCNCEANKVQRINASIG